MPVVAGLWLGYLGAPQGGEKGRRGKEGASMIHTMRSATTGLVKGESTSSKQIQADRGGIL